LAVIAASGAPLSIANVQLPEGILIGYDADTDRQHYLLTDSGLEVVTREHFFLSPQLISRRNKGSRVHELGQHRQRF
jgi:hypothetical protein